jgi:hypothetical protein
MFTAFAVPIEKGVNPDTKKYLLLLYASAANLLSFAGYTQKSVYKAVTQQRQKDLRDFDTSSTTTEFRATSKNAPTETATRPIRQIRRESDLTRYVARKAPEGEE